MNKNLQTFWKIMISVLMLTPMLTIAQPFQHPFVKDWMRTIRTKRQNAPVYAARMQATAGLPASFNYTWDVGISGWRLTDTSMYQYNAAGRVEQEIVLSATGMQRVQTSYDAQGRIIQELYADFVPGSGWQNSYEAQYAFDVQGRRVLFLEMTYANGAILDTVYGEKVEVQVDPVHALPIVEHHFVLSAAGFDTTLRREYTYNSALQLRTVREFQNTYTGWALHGEIRYGWRNGTIDTVNIAVTNATPFLTDVLRYVNITYHQWNGSFETSKPQRYSILVNMGQGLFITSRSTYTYDAFGGYVQVDSAFDFAVPVAWRPSDRFTYEVDPQGNFRGEKHEVWNVSAWEIETHQRFTYQYTPSYQVDELIYSEFDRTTNAYQNEWRRDYTMQLVAGIEKEKQDQPGVITVFPNPVSGAHAQLSMQVKQEEPLTIAIHDGLGRQLVSVKTEEVFSPGTHIIPLQLEWLTPGTYCVRVFGRKNHQTIRFVVQ